MKKFALPLIGLALGATALTAHAEPAYNQVSFEVSVTKVVANDELVATLTHSVSHTDIKEIATRLTTANNKALDLAKKYPNVKLITGRNHTSPNFNVNGTSTDFSGSSSVNVISHDFGQASKLIAELQTFMTLENLDFGVASTTKQAVENELKIQAINQFGDEARTVSRAFGAKDYKIVRADLNHGNSYLYAKPQMAYARDSLDSGSSMPIQQYESGDSRLTYTINGVIELVK